MTARAVAAFGVATGMVRAVGHTAVTMTPVGMTPRGMAALSVTAARVTPMRHTGFGMTPRMSDQSGTKTD